MIKKIEVVAAAIFSPCGTELFIARRLKNAHQGGLWEFPGGKKESNETPDQALYRELNEELGITVVACKPLIKLSHDYGDKLIELDVYRVDAFQGRAHGAEGQETRWIKLADLNQFSFPEANKPIVDLLLKAVVEESC
jgi:8-oxo-dGTP diphosphatase